METLLFLVLVVLCWAFVSAGLPILQAIIFGFLALIVMFWIFILAGNAISERVNYPGKYRAKRETKSRDRAEKKAKYELERAEANARCVDKKAATAELERAEAVARGAITTARAERKAVKIAAKAVLRNTGEAMKREQRDGPILLEEQARQAEIIAGLEEASGTIRSTNEATCEQVSQPIACLKCESVNESHAAYCRTCGVRLGEEWAVAEITNSAQAPPLIVSLQRADKVSDAAEPLRAETPAVDDMVLEISKRTGLGIEEIVRAKKVLLSKHCLELIQTMPGDFSLQNMRRAESAGEIAHAMELAAGLVRVAEEQIQTDAEAARRHAEDLEAAKSEVPDLADDPHLAELIAVEKQYPSQAAHWRKKQLDYIERKKQLATDVSIRLEAEKREKLAADAAKENSRAERLAFDQAYAEKFHAEEEAKQASVAAYLVKLQAERAEAEKRAQAEDAMRRADEEQRCAEEKEARRNNETRHFETLRQEGLQIANAHLNTLLIQRRQKLYKDAYGRTIVDRWLKEVWYFVSTSAIPKISLDAIRQWRSARCIRRYNSTVSPDGNARALEFSKSLIETNLGDDEVGELMAMLTGAVYDFVESRASGEQQPCENVDDPTEFELACEAILRGAGWDARRIGQTGDQGADVIASRDGITAVFQCKLYASAVGNSAVQEIHAAKSFYAANMAAVVSRSGYTKSARQAAEAIGVSLLDVGELATFNAK